MTAERLAFRGVEFALTGRLDAGVTAVHESAASAEIWRPLAEAGTQLLAYDRRGWGGSEAPPDYARTTVEEHAEDLVALLKSGGAPPRVLVGSGFGAVVALSVAARHASLVQALVLVEPPLFTFLPEAAAGLAADAKRVAEAARAGGPPAVAKACVRGELRWLGPGTGRLPPAIAEAALSRPKSLIAELAAVPAWPVPFTEVRRLALPAAIVTGAGTPPNLVAAADALAERMPGADRVVLAAEGLPHYDGAAELASLISDAA